MLSGHPGTPSVPGRFGEGGGGLQPGAEPEDPDDPSSHLQRHLTAASQPAGLALSL